MTILANANIGYKISRHQVDFVKQYVRERVWLISSGSHNPAHKWHAAMDSIYLQMAIWYELPVSRDILF